MLVSAGGKSPKGVTARRREENLVTKGNFKRTIWGILVVPLRGLSERNLLARGQSQITRRSSNSLVGAVSRISGTETEPSFV